MESKRVFFVAQVCLLLIKVPFPHFGVKNPQQKLLLPFVQHVVCPLNSFIYDI